MKKNICAMLIAVVTMGAVIPAEAIKIINWDSLQTQLNLGGVAKLTHDLSAANGGNGSLTVETDVTLDLNGHTLDAAGQFGVIVIYSGGHLTLTNSVPGSGAITGGRQLQQRCRRVRVWRRQVHDGRRHDLRQHGQHPRWRRVRRPCHG